MTPNKKMISEPPHLGEPAPLVENGQLDDEQTVQECVRALNEVLTAYQCQLQIVPQLTLVINGQTIVPQVQIARKP